MNASVVFLDPTADASLPADATLLSSERTFLEHAVGGRFGNQRYVVQGQALCTWVREWCEGRDYACSQLESPNALWRRIYPLWTEEQLRILQQRSGFTVPPETAEEALAALCPDGPWQGVPGHEQVARWAFWLEEAGIEKSDPVLPLFRLFTARWQEDAAGNDGPFSQAGYALETAEQSQAFLEDWMLSGTASVPFTAAVPDRWRERAATKWRYAPMDEGAEKFWARIASGGICPDLRRVASQIVYDYLKQNPGDITDALVLSLRSYLSATLWQDLRRHRPPEVPRELSPVSSPSSVLDWVSTEYLPFRQWQVLHGDAGHLEQVMQRAQGFADWLLAFYPEALGGGRGNDLLAITRSAQLQHPGTGVTLWVILDGMPLPDGERLLELISEDKRLTVGERRTCFTTLPTITCFCKPALLNGCPPEHLDIIETPTPGFPAAIQLKDKTMRDQAAQAAPGQVLVWSHKEPDAIYHRNQSRETTLADVDGKLRTIAEQIRELAGAVPEDRNLTVVVTTDHGRLLADHIPRSHPLPKGAKSEGRAAWGDPAEGAQDGLVNLPSDTFRLPKGVDAWVARDNAAFVQGNGSGGTVSFPHGGLWPEEVIIPWFTLVRDALVPRVRVRVSGSGRSGGSGKLTFLFDNAGDVPVTVLSVRLRSSGENWGWDEGIDLAVLEQKQGAAERTLDRWPSGQDSEQVTGTALVSLANGVTFELPTEVALQSDALYQRGLDAEDLLDL